MHDPDPLMDYLAICREIYERMEREGTWLWAEEDSTECDDVVDSDCTP